MGKCSAKVVITISPTFEPFFARSFPESLRTPRQQRSGSISSALLCYSIPQAFDFPLLLTLTCAGIVLPEVGSWTYRTRTLHCLLLVVLASQFGASNKFSGISVAVKL